MGASLMKSVLLFWGAVMGTTLSERDCAIQAPTACHLCELCIQKFIILHVHTPDTIGFLVCHVHKPAV